MSSDLALLEELLRKSASCLPDSTVSTLYRISTRLLKGLSVPNEVSIVLPNSLILIIPTSQLPEVWNNILHVFCFKDYTVLDDFKPRKGWVVIDVGAYIGVYTLYASSLVNADGKVIAVEPNPLSRYYLIENVRINELGNVRIISKGLADHEGRMKLYITDYWANSSFIHEYARSLGSVIKELNVRVITMDELINELGINHVDLVKIDVEGLELKVLRGSTNSLASKVIERLVVEVHKGFVDVDELINLLRSHGYEVFIHDPKLEHQLFLYARVK